MRNDLTHDDHSANQHDQCSFYKNVVLVNSVNSGNRVKNNAANGGSAGFVPLSGRGNPSNVAGGRSYSQVSTPNASTVKNEDIRQLFGNMTAMLAQIIQKLS